MIRLRSGIIGLLGLVAAVGLGLVAIISQQGWPDVFSGPLPNAPAPAVVQNETIALGRGPVEPAPAHRRRSPRESVDRGSNEGSTSSPRSSGLAGSRAVETPSTGPAPASPPPAQPGPDSSNPPGSSPPPGSAPPATSTPVAVVAGATNDGGDGNRSSRHSGKSKSHSQDDDWDGHGRPDWADRDYEDDHDEGDNDDDDDDDDKGHRRGKPDWGRH